MATSEGKAVAVEEEGSAGAEAAEAG